MIWEAIGELLPAAAVIAANPFVVIVVVVLLAGGGLARGVGYLAGWILGLGVLTAVVVVAAGALDADEDPTWLGAVRLVIGLALIAAGVRAWKRRPRNPDERKTPSWMAGLESAGPARAFGIGVLLAAANPKHIALIATNASFISQVHPSVAGSILAGAILVAVGASSVAACVLLATFAGASGQRTLATIEDFLTEHADILVAAVIVLIGVKITGDGISGLGQR